MRGVNFGTLAASLINGYVKSVQQVSITIGSGANSNTATINAVDTSRTLIIFQGVTVDSGGTTLGSSHLARLALTNSTTITATRGPASAVSLTIKCQVVEFTSRAVDSVQYGTVSIAASTSATAAISAIDLSRSAVFLLGTETNTGSISATTGYGRVDFNGSTTSVRGRTGATTTSTIGFAVVQFAAGVIQSVQHAVVLETGGGTTATATITAVNTNRCWLPCNGFSSTDAHYNDSFYTYTLTDSTTLTGTLIGTDASTTGLLVTVIEFADGVLKSNPQRGTISLAGATSATATISAVDTNKTVCGFLGFRCTSSTAANTALQSIEMTNSTTVTGRVNTSDASARAVGYEIIEFN